MYGFIFVITALMLLFASTAIAQKMDDRKYRRYNDGTGHHRRTIQTK